MTIPHATITKAEKLGFSISEDRSGDTPVVVVRDKKSKESIGAPRPAPEVLGAAILMRTFFYEYPALDISWDYTNEGKWLVAHNHDASHQVAVPLSP